MNVNGIRRREFLVQATASFTAGASCLTNGSAFGQQERWQRLLSEHRLQNCETTQVQLNWPRQVGKNSRKDVHGNGARPTVVTVTTDKGATGWGAARGNPQAVAAALAKLKGKPLGEMFAVATGITTNDATPLDFALHDLAGVILQKPVYELLGAGGVRATDCYSGMIYFDDLEPPEKPAGIEAVMKNCRADIQRGYRQLKVKIGRGSKWMSKEEGIRRDIEITCEIARRFPDVTILVDGNDGFTCDEMIQYLDGIGDVKLFWIEEPFRETREDYSRLRKWLAKQGRKTLLADGEAKPDFPLLDRLFQENLLDVQLVDIVGYGFTPWRKLIANLNQRGVLSSPHAWGHLLKTHYVSHLAAGMGGVVTIEGVTCSSDDVDFGNYRMVNGKLVVSDEPGFGMKLLKQSGK